MTPALDDGVVERLYAYALPFRPLFGRSDQFKQGRIYLHGLLVDGERKSIEPLSRRVPGGNEQRLQQFVNQSPWDATPILRLYRAQMAEAFASATGVVVIDDTGFAKQGRHSVGVARQYSGTLGQRGNCQVATSLHYAGEQGDYPLGLRLYLPESWTGAPERMDRARVPQDERSYQTKGQIALALLDRTVLGEGLPHRAVVADAGYGAGSAFRQGLEARGQAYVVGLLGTEGVWTDPPVWAVPPGGRAQRQRLCSAPPRYIGDLATSLERRRVSWREGRTGPLWADFAWVRVWLAHDWKEGRAPDDCPDAAAAARWLLVEWRRDGQIKYALSNLPADTPVETAVALWKTRWQVERGYQQLKEELGLDHFEGRGWPGFHHHAAMTFLAYGFLQLERQRAAEALEAEPPPEDPSPGGAERGA